MYSVLISAQLTAVLEIQLADTHPHTDNYRMPSAHAHQSITMSTNQTPRWYSISLTIDFIDGHFQVTPIAG